ncbi:hypothetical protein N824_16600 [Pedobacter sp. V48]|nr:hypothetical protein N824_16600 [Pedobacter sp. V48]
MERSPWKLAFPHVTVFKSIPANCETEQGIDPKISISKFVRLHSRPSAKQSPGIQLVNLKFSEQLNDLIQINRL